MRVCQFRHQGISGRSASSPPRLAISARRAPLAQKKRIAKNGLRKGKFEANTNFSGFGFIEKK
ncbi:MAG: hypothetical protein COZ87_03085 [Candidatus Moranbacteria bacterium CG_4_8_14_3_um_filter_43_15]|nr:MAG: hypothetical protein COZ87_03085 [Candidatus Moranbacteria bacterium CG_4_8_14_3_um_filter_43_15]